MTILDELAVNVVMYTGGLARGATKGAGYLGKLTAATSKSRLGMIGWGAVATAAAAAAARAFARMRQEAEVLDKIGKTAAKLGMATDELMALRFAGEQTGVENKKLDMSLQRMTRRLAEAAKGTGEAQGAIRELGLDAAKLKAAGPAAALYEIADAFESVEAPADRVRLAFKLFDAEGVDLVNTLAAGSAGLKEMADQAAALNQTLTTDQVAAVEASNDAWNRFEKARSGWWKQFTAKMAPAMESMANELTYAVSGESFGASHASFGPWEDGVADAAAATAATAEEMAKMETAAGKIAESTIRPLERLAAEQDEINRLYREGVLDVKTWHRALSANKRAMFDSSIGGEVHKVTMALGKQIHLWGMSREEIQLWELKARGASDRALADARYYMGKLAKLREDQAAAEKQAAEAAQRRADIESRAASVRSEVMTDLERDAKKRDDLKELLDVGAIDRKTYARAIAAADADLRRDVFGFDTPGSTAAAASRGPAGMDKGSVEAIRFLNQTQTAGQRREARQLAELEKLNRNIVRVVDAIDRQEPVRIEEVGANG